MRIYDIALFMLLVNVTMAFTVNQGLFESSRFGSAIPLAPDQELIGKLNASEQNATGWLSFGSSDATAFILQTLSALLNIVDIIWSSTFGIPWTITEFLGGSSAASAIGWLVGIPMWAVYIFAIAQFLRGVGAKGME